MSEYYDDDSSFPHWPTIRYSTAEPDYEFRIPDYLWVDSAEANAMICNALMWLHTNQQITQLGRSNEFNYNYLQVTEHAAFVILLQYPELLNYCHRIKE